MMAKNKTIQVGQDLSGQSTVKRWRKRRRILGTTTIAETVDAALAGRHRLRAAPTAHGADRPGRRHRPEPGRAAPAPRSRRCSTWPTRSAWWRSRATSDSAARAACWRGATLAVCSPLELELLYSARGQLTIRSSGEELEGLIALHATTEPRPRHDTQQARERQEHRGEQVELRRDLRIRPARDGLTRTCHSQPERLVPRVVDERRDASWKIATQQWKLQRAARRDARATRSDAARH